MPASQVDGADGSGQALANIPIFTEGWKIIHMERKPGTADLVRLAFIFFGAVQVLIGVNLLSDDTADRVGYMMSGSGLVLLGFSFSPSYFLSKPGENHAHMTLTTKVVCVAGFAIVILGERLVSL